MQLMRNPLSFGLGRRHLISKTLGVDGNSFQITVNPVKRRLQPLMIIALEYADPLLIADQGITHCGPPPIRHSGDSARMKILGVVRNLIESTPMIGKMR